MAAFESLGELVATDRENAPCTVCGTPATDQYFGFPCCCPYGPGGSLVRRCKHTLEEVVISDRERANSAAQFMDELSTHRSAVKAGKLPL